MAGTFQQIHLSGARRWVYDRLGGRYAYEEHVRAIGTRAPILTGWIVLVATLTPADDKTAHANNGMIWISGESETTKGFHDNFGFFECIVAASACARHRSVFLLLGFFRGNPTSAAAGLYPVDEYFSKRLRI